MAKRGWHQDQIDRAHESAGTLRADREASQAAAELHLSSVTATATTPPPSQGG